MCNSGILYWYVALAEDKIFYGRAPDSESCHLLPNLIREKLLPQLSLSSLKTEVFIYDKPLRDRKAAIAYCEAKKHVARGEYRFLDVINMDLG